MNLLISVAVVSLFIAPSFHTAQQNYGLPTGAFVIETKTITLNRTLVLWMMNPKKVPRDTPDEPYTCPEETRGSYYSGPTRVSLVNPKNHTIINSITIKSEEDGAEDAFDLPYQIHIGKYYKVIEGTARPEGKPDLMWLGDYNGDGKALEFALFDAVACMELQTTLIGYSEKRDRVIQYPIKLVAVNGKERQIEVVHWIDYLFSKPANKPRYWKYEIDYRGRGGTLDKYEIRYNKQRERFEGRVDYVRGE